MLLERTVTEKLPEVNTVGI